MSYQSPRAGFGHYMPSREFTSLELRYPELLMSKRGWHEPEYIQPASSGASKYGWIALAIGVIAVCVSAF